MAFTTHPSIIEGVRRNEDSAWQRFVDYYIPLIRLCGRDHNVPEMYLDDLISNVFFAIAAGKMDFDATRGRFIYFLRGVIRNKSHELLRSISRQEILKTQATHLFEEVDDGDFAEIHVEEWRKYVRRWLWEKLQKELSPLHFQIFDFLFLRHWPAARVADYLHISLPNVYVARKSIIKKCRAARLHLQER